MGVSGERPVEGSLIVAVRLALDHDRADRQRDEPDRKDEQEHATHAHEAGGTSHSSATT
jgi:hypothetical protein